MTKLESGIHAPQAICDHCDQPVLIGKAIWPLAQNPTEAKFVHRHCYEPYVKDKGGSTAWGVTALDAFLYNVMHNAQIDIGQARIASDVLGA